MILRISRRERSGQSGDWDDAALEIVPMRKKALRQVLAIESEIFPGPWSYGLFASEIALTSSRAYYVAQHHSTVVGYAGLMFGCGEGHVMTIGVAPFAQRHGVARRLLLTLAEEGIRHGVRALTLEVRLSNTGAQALYHEFGFVPAGVRKNYYPEVNEDALVMWAYDIDTPGYRARLDEITSRAALRDRQGR